MTYKVAVSSPYNYSIKISQPSSFKISTTSDMPKNLNDLANVDISGDNDKYVLMYDASTEKWRDVNPDAVLSAASNTETTQPGLPGDFVNTLDVDLDNKIDLDAGGF